MALLVFLSALITIFSASCSNPLFLSSRNVYTGTKKTGTKKRKLPAPKTPVPAQHTPQKIIPITSENLRQELYGCYFIDICTTNRTSQPATIGALEDWRKKILDAGESGTGLEISPLSYNYGEPSLQQYSFPQKDQKRIQAWCQELITCYQGITPLCGYDRKMCKLLSQSSQGYSQEEEIRFQAAFSNSPYRAWLDFTCLVDKISSLYALCIAQHAEQRAKQGSAHQGLAQRAGGKARELHGAICCKIYEDYFNETAPRTPHAPRASYPYTARLVKDYIAAYLYDPEKIMATLCTVRTMKTLSTQEQATPPPFIWVQNATLMMSPPDPTNLPSHWLKHINPVLASTQPASQYHITESITAAPDDNGCWIKGRTITKAVVISIHSPSKNPYTVLFPPQYPQALFIVGCAIPTIIAAVSLPAESFSSLAIYTEQHRTGFQRIQGKILACDINSKNDTLVALVRIAGKGDRILIGQYDNTKCIFDFASSNMPTPTISAVETTPPTMSVGTTHFIYTYLGEVDGFLRAHWTELPQSPTQNSLRRFIAPLPSAPTSKFYFSRNAEYATCLTKKGLEKGYLVIGPNQTTTFRSIPCHPDSTVVLGPYGEYVGIHRQQGSLRLTRCYPTAPLIGARAQEFSKRGQAAQYILYMISRALPLMHPSKKSGTLPPGAAEALKQMGLSEALKRFLVITNPS